MSAVHILLGAAVAGLVLGLIAQRLDVAFTLAPGVNPDAVAAPIFERVANDPLRGQLPMRAIAGLPAYPNARPVSLGDIQTQGVSMNAAWFQTTDTPEEVTRYYQRALAEAGLPMVSDEISPNGAAYIGYKQADSESMHVISVVPYMGETLVLLSNGRAGDILIPRSSQQVPPELPHPPEAEGAMVFEIRSEGTVQRSIVARVPAGDIEALVSFYERGFEDKGWRIHSVETLTPRESRLEARKGDAAAEVVLKSIVQNAGPEVQLLIMMTGKL